MEYLNLLKSQQIVTEILDKYSILLWILAEPDPKPVLWIRIQVQSDPYIIGSSGSGSNSLKTDHKFKHLEYFMTFLKICLKSFQIFSSVLKEFLHNHTKYDINWKILKKNSKKLFLCHKIAWIRIRIRILFLALDPDPDPDRYIECTYPQHCPKHCFQSSKFMFDMDLVLDSGLENLIKGWYTKNSASTTL